MSSDGRQLELFRDPWRPYQERVDRLAIQFGHLASHVPEGDPVVGYWVALISKSLSSFSFDLQEESTLWREDQGGPVEAAEHR